MSSTVVDSSGPHHRFHMDNTEIGMPLLTPGRILGGRHWGDQGDDVPDYDDIIQATVAVRDPATSAAD
ncbi:MAG: hypothetical protein LBV00_11805, partial [Propionibacteriaceae bacterium]|nr:hypothetical protein [Propionibacteriaceae bacterium]